MGRIEQDAVIRMISDSLEQEVTLDTTMEDVEDWDSLGHLKIMSDLDAEFDNRLAEIRELATADSVRKILDILRTHSFI